MGHTIITRLGIAYSQRLRPFALLLGTLVICYQFFVWQSHALRVSALQMKSIIRELSLREELELGSICNSLDNPSCARRVFGQVLERFPNQRTALANLGIAEARSRQWLKALELFDRYMAAGGQAFDVLYWKGRCHAELGQSEKALAAYYSSLAQAPDESPAGDALIDYLFSLERYEEALSIIGSLTNGHPAQSPLWRGKFADMTARLRSRQAEEPLTSKRALRLPSLAGRKFMVPVRFSADAPFDFFSINREREVVSINEDLLLQVAFKIADERRPAGETGQTRMRLPQLQVGPWLYPDVDFVVCRDCVSELGQSLLTQFDVYEQMEGGVQFLVLFPL